MLVKFWIIINAIFYLWLAMASWLRPTAIAKMIGYQLLTGGAVAEFKAMYGGVSLCITLYSVYLYCEGRFQDLMVFFTILYLCFFLGRSIGVIGTRNLDRTTTYYLLIEILSFGISFFLYRNLQK